MAQSPIHFLLTAHDRTSAAFASARRNMATMETRVRSLVGSFGLTGALTGGFAVRELVRYADTWTRTGNLLAAAGVEMDKVAGRQQELIDLAIRTRTEFDATAELYARMMRSTASLGISHEELARATETVNKAFKVSGAATSEQVNAIRQLSQALAAGALQGDELRSIRENAPVVAQAIADEFNTTIGGLKKLGSEGKLTADRIFKALLRSSSEIDAQFERINVTIGDAFTNLGSAITEYIGLGDSSEGASQKIAGGIMSIADAVRDSESSFAALGREIRREIEIFTDAIAVLMSAKDLGFTREGFGAMREEIRKRFLGSDLPDLELLDLAGFRQRQDKLAVGGKRNPPPPSAADDDFDKVRTKLQFELDQIGRTNREREIANALNQAGLEITQAQAAELSNLAGRLHDVRTQQEAMGDAWAFAGEIARDSLTELFPVLDELDSRTKKIIDALLDAVLLGQGPLAGLFGTAPTGASSVGGLFGKLFGSVSGAPLTGWGATVTPAIAGARAGGGPVEAGKSYLVGERRPEIFTPGRSGMISPMGGGAPRVDIQIINNTGSPVTTKREQRGGVDIHTIIVGEMKKAIVGGEVNNEMGAAFGVSPSARRR